MGPLRSLSLVITLAFGSLSLVTSGFAFNQ